MRYKYLKILLDDHHGIGDVAMFLSVLCSIKEKYPDSEIHMLVKSSVEQNLVETVGGVKKFYYYDPLNHNIKSICQLIMKLRKNKYDLGICHIGTSSKFGPLLMKAIGCKSSVGSDSGRKYLNYTIAVDTSKQKQRARKNALLLSGIGCENVKETGLLSSLNFKGIISSSIKGKFENNKVIGICIGTGNTIIQGTPINGKKWPDTYWIELIKKFIRNGYKIIILGGKKEKTERSDAFNDLSSDDVMDLVGQLKLEESLEAISQCDLLIAGDTGLGFCSALMDIPTLSLLGPSGPELAAPYGKNSEFIYLGLECSPCYGKLQMKECLDRKCMRNITVEMVYEKSVEMMNNIIIKQEPSRRII